jgi:hypothetical protein
MEVQYNSGDHTCLAQKTEAARSSLQASRCVLTATAGRLVLHSFTPKELPADAGLVDEATPGGSPDCQSPHVPIARGPTTAY